MEISVGHAGSYSEVDKGASVARNRVTLHLPRTHLKKIAFALLLVGLALFIYSKHREIEERGSLSRFDRSLIFLTAPAARGVVFLKNRIQGLFDDYVFLVGVSRENRRLTKEIEEARVREMLCRDEEKENERLRGLVELKERLSDRWVGVAARVISHPPVSPHRILTIDKGQQAGIERRAPVIASNGLVGQVARMTANYSQVLLITDPASAVDALVGERRGLVVGKTVKLELKREFYLSAFEHLKGSGDLEEGMPVLTSGLDEIYPPGVPIGSVRVPSEVLPAVDFHKLKEVLVLKRRPRP